MDKALTQIQDSLESIKRVTQDENPMEFWSARDLMPMLGYTTWRKFTEAINRAKEACVTGGQAAGYHFAAADKKVLTGSTKI